MQKGFFMETKPSHQKRPASLAIYLLLAFGITWLGWIPALVIADSQSYTLPTIANFNQVLQAGLADWRHVLLSIIFSLAVYGPLVGGIVATRIESGKEGLTDLFQRMINWQVEIKWYAFALGIAIVMPLTPRLIAELAGQMAPQAGDALGWSLPLLVGVFLWQFVTSGLGEEPGWRGYLLPRFQSRHGEQKAIWLLGLVWAVWHYPITMYDTVTNMGAVPFIGVVITLLMALLGQTLSLIGMTHLYAWLYDNTQSVFLAIVFHALTNFLPRILLTGVSPSLSLLIAVMPWVVVFVLERANVLSKEESEKSK
jgi:membrane protease YdiL (CAAX protease family)